MADVHLEHELQKKILLKLIHAPELSFNELWAKDGESNVVAYHINRLEAAGLIEKRPSGAYGLTSEGRRLSAFIEGDTGSKAEFPTLTVLMMVRDGDRFLCQRRLKEPFYGYWGFVSGKINFGQNLFECASRDILEETGLTVADWTFKGMEQIKTFESDRLLFHHYVFWVEGRTSSGVLKVTTHKASHEWLLLDDFKDKEFFPRPGFLEHMLPAKAPILMETERYMEAGRFIGGKNVSVTRF